MEKIKPITLCLKTTLLWVFMIQVGILFAQPSANFDYEVLDGCVPTSIQFTNTSTGNIVNYSWVIEDSFVSGDVNPVLDFVIASEYQICLQVTDTNGETNEYCETIEVYAKPDADFVASPTSACTFPLQVLFTPSVVGNANYTFEWFFGDDSSSDAIAPIHQYVSEGSFDVTLVVTDVETGCQDTLLQEDFIQIGSASAEFSTQNLFNGNCNNTEILFSINDTSNIQSVLWDFGNGETSTALNPIYVYADSGCFTPSLTLMSNSNCTTTWTANECIESNGTLEVSYSAIGELISCDTDGLEVQFLANAPGAIEFNWGFGALGGSNEQNPTFVFDEIGVYPISMTAFYADGCIASVVDTTVVIAPVEIAFEANRTSGCEGLEVDFQNISDIPFPIQSYAWDFGFTTSNIENPSITFPQRGAYTVSLTIVTESGCEGTLSLEDYILVGSEPDANFTANTFETCADAPIFFTNNSSSNASEFLWDFGDGESSMLENPIHFYADTGFLDVTLIAIDNSCSDTLTIDGFIHILPPIAQFEYENDCNSNAVSFINNSIAADTYFWEFGDGNTSTEDMPTHIYSDFGTYTVKLTVFSGNNSCSDESKLEINLTNPTANFSLDYEGIICPGNRVQVLNNSVDASAYEWIFDSNNIEIEAQDTLLESVSFVFPYAGTYTGFGLVITDIENCQDTLMLNDTIIVNDLEAEFETAIISPCFPVEVQFLDLSTTNNGETISYFWDFGDENTSTEETPIHIYQSSGNYAISLTIKDSWGCSITTEQFIDLDVGILNPIFSVQQNDCSSIQLDILNNTISADEVNYFWDFGDGTSSEEINPQHEFLTEGMYTVCLTANNNNCEAVHCQELEVFYPEADFSADNVTSSCIDNPLVVSFIDEAQGTSAWEWDFGDEQGSSIEENPSYTYTEAGNYTVCLITSNQFGCRDTLCRKNLIQIEGPNGTIESNLTNTCTDLDVLFSVETENTANYILDFGNGETIEGSGNLVIDSLLYSYLEPGTFVPTLMLVDTADCMVNIEAPLAIEVEDAGIDFTSTNTVFCEDDIQSINFFTVANNIAEINSIQWLFPGAQNPTSTDLNPANVVYNEAGTYTVTMLVETDHCSSEIIKEELVLIDTAPVANYSITNNVICANELLEFENTTAHLDSTYTSLWQINGETIDSSTHFEYTFNQAGIYELTLEVSNQNNCASSFTEIIFIFQGIELDIGESETLCQGQSIQLTPYISAPNEVLYEWTPTEGLDCTTCLNPTASPSQSTTYYLTALTSDGCMATDSIAISVSELPLPNINLLADTTICAGETIQLLASSTESTANFYWNTTSQGLDCYENCASPLATPQETTTYYLEVFNQEGCSNIDSVQIVVLVNDETILGEDLSICEGNTTTLEVLNGNNPIWENNPTLDCNNCPNPVANPTENTNYIVQVVADNACILTDTILVDVVENIDVFAGEDQAVCLGDSVLLQANYPGEIVWTNNGNLIALNESATIIYPTQSGVYSLNVLNGNCSFTDQLQIEVYENSEVWVSDYEICEGEEIMLSVGGFATDFEWMPSPDLNDFDSNNPIASPSETTTFTLVGTAGTCPPDTAQVLVEVHENPSIDYDQFIPFRSGTELVLQPNIEGTGTLTYSWTPSESLSCANCPNPTAFPSSNTLYELTVQDENGCTNSLEIQLQVIQLCQENTIVVPSAFTPNQDGENDVFYIRGTADVTLLQIYNRWGERIFETNNPNTGWDGTHNGEQLNRDVFVYYVEATCDANGETIIQTGDITLIR